MKPRRIALSVLVLVLVLAVPVAAQAPQPPGEHSGLPDKFLLLRPSRAPAAPEAPASPDVALGEPGTVYSYQRTFGDTQAPYLADSQHLNRPNGLIVDGNATPYRFYRQTMSSELLAPEGTPAEGNYTRYAGGKADELLSQFASSTDPDEQKQIALELQKVFAEEVPTVPLTPLGGMGLVNTTHFTGFPTADNHYASAQPNPPFFADILLVLSQLTPK